MVIPTMLKPNHGRMHRKATLFRLRELRVSRPSSSLRKLCCTFWRIFNVSRTPPPSPENKITALQLSSCSYFFPGLWNTSEARGVIVQVSSFLQYGSSAHQSPSGRCCHSTTQRSPASWHLLNFRPALEQSCVSTDILVCRPYPSLPEAQVPAPSPCHQAILHSIRPPKGRIL